MFETDGDKTLTEGFEVNAAHSRDNFGIATLTPLTQFTIKC